MVNRRVPGRYPIRLAQWRCPVSGCTETSDGAVQGRCRVHKVPMESDDPTDDG